MRIDQLPTFTISQLEHDRAIGRFDKPLWIGERHVGHLLLPDERLVSGRFVDVNLQSHTAAFVPTASEEILTLLPGVTYPRFDGYWGERAALVLDRQRLWSQQTFGPFDSVDFKRVGDASVGEVTNQKLPERGTVMQGGWDHEHCAICWATIFRQTDPVAMFSAPDHWICRRCYESFVVPRSLDFIHMKDPGH